MYFCIYLKTKRFAARGYTKFRILSENSFKKLQNVLRLNCTYMITYSQLFIGNTGLGDQIQIKYTHVLV